MSWEKCDGLAIVKTMYIEMFIAYPNYQDFFKFRGVPLQDLDANDDFCVLTKLTTAFIDRAVAGTADFKGLAHRHTQRGIKEIHFRHANDVLARVAADYGCTTDFSGAIEAIITNL